MKNHLGIVISNNGNSAKVKIDTNKHKAKIIEAANIEGAIVGEEVYVELSKVLKLKLIYIKFIQPIIFAIVGIITGRFMGDFLNQPDLVYNCVFTCLFITIAFIYKDYVVEKNKFSLKYLPTIKKIK